MSSNHRPHGQFWGIILLEGTSLSKVGWAAFYIDIYIHTLMPGPAERELFGGEEGCVLLNV